MAKHKLIVVEGSEIRFYNEQEDDFLSLTDIARKFNERTDQVILNWMRTRSTVEFLGAWEMLHNAGFDAEQFEQIRNQTGSAAFVLSVRDWVGNTHAVGIRAQTGRYGGTFAHRDIAFEFLSYLNPTFKLYVIKEFQRLKSEEAVQAKKELDWNLKRMLAKVNYRIHTEAVREYLIPPRLTYTKSEGIYFASEADLLNKALFGLTAREWRLANPEMRGNMRDYASAEQLLVLSNIENLNAEFLHQGMPQHERLNRLNEVAIYQLELLLDIPAVRGLDGGGEEK
jgi:hypothetical protein